jgi:RNA polymerase sigma-70 factor, ECF subfamily
MEFGPVGDSPRGKRPYLGDKNLSDSDLVAQVKGGDHDAFRVLVERYSNKAYWTAYNIVRTHEDAQDIAQEGFIRVYRFLDRYDTQQRFTTWLYQIVVNLAIDSLRRRKNPAALENVPEVVADDAGPVNRAELTEQQERVWEILGSVPDQYRVILVLRDIEGLPSQEVADVLNVNHATVRWRLHRGRALFREAWEARYGTSAD